MLPINSEKKHTDRRKRSQFDEGTHGQMFVHDVILRDEAAKMFDLCNATWAPRRKPLSHLEPLGASWSQPPHRQSTSTVKSKMERNKNRRSNGKFILKIPSLR